MATNTPPHNLTEIIQATIALIQNPVVVQLPDSALDDQVDRLLPRRPFGGNFRVAKINRSKSASTQISAQALYNQAVWPVNFGITGPICARASKVQIPWE